ncbi:MAG TPA: biopolymer transporter ExbD [Steroidobacteraceae bacterium]|nr:biopolymer transporter ExbD [Steroidobacteraceae bacterium]
MSVESPAVEPQMNATPLIDVMLVLLIILIMTVPIAAHAVKLNLPQGPQGPPQPSVRLDIAFDGTIYWNGEFIASIAALTPKFEAVLRKADPPAISVIPEKRTKYERVAQVLAAAQRSHVTKMSVAPIAEP